MPPAEIAAAATQILAEIAKLYPVAMQNPADRDNGKGNVSVLIIAESGQIFGHMFGDDNRTRRETLRNAWHKGTQVWMTNQSTGKFEQQVYGPANVDPGRFGLRHPDLIGWMGGLPVVAKDGTKFAVAVSGFTGETDCQIIRDAVKAIPQLRMAE